MEKQAQIELLRKVNVDSLPDYILKRLYQEAMTEEEETRTDKFCTRLAELLSQNHVQTTVEAAPNHGWAFELLSSVEEKSLPDFAVKYLKNEELTPEEVQQVGDFCTRLAATQKT